MNRLLFISLMTAACLLVFGLAAGAQTKEAKSGSETRVIDDRVPVYTRMATSGSPVHTLTRGDKVVVQFEMEKASRAWCSIIHEGEATVSGYVECRHLARQKRQQWELIERTGNAAPTGGFIPPNMSATKVRVVNNQVLVPVSLNYRGAEVPVEMLLDTGAGGTIIKSEVARRLGLDLDSAINVKAVVVGGGTIDVKIVQITQMTVGPHQVPSPVVGVIEHAGVPVPFDGILGMDFLGSVEYRVDLTNQVISWGR